MFQNRRQSTLGNINLGSLSAPPSYQDMNFLQEQAMRYRGRFVEVGWHVPKTGVTFQLTAKFVSGQNQPAWMLYRGMGGGSELIWGHTSNDLTLMHNLVMLECEKPANGDGGNSISAGAMDNVMSTSQAHGSVAGLPQQGGHAAAGGQSALETAGQARASAPKPQVGPTQNPANTWLQNLSQSQSTETAKQKNPANVMDKPAGATTTATAEEDVQTGPLAVDDQSPVYSGAAPGEMLLDGSLINISVPKLLRYVSQNKLTGRLALQASLGAAEVFFKSGDITHAATLDCTGEHGLLDASTWTDGEFHFVTDDLTPQVSLTRDTEALIKACDRMLALSKFLQQEQVRTASYLVRKEEYTRENFLSQLGNTPEVHQIWRLYELIDGNRSLSEILRSSPMTRAEWIPAIYVLLNSHLAAVTERPLKARPGMFIEGAPLDTGGIEAYLNQFCEGIEGVFAAPAFLFFLQQEHYRFERTGCRYALGIFSFGTCNLLDGNTAMFNRDMMQEAGARINKAKRKLDIMGHFDQMDYALLMPDTDSAGAAVFANRILDLLKKPALFPGDEVLVSAFGIASVPDDVRDLSSLVAAARAAKSRSKMVGSPVCVYGAQ